MAFSGKLEANVEMKSSTDKVYEFFTCTPYLLTKSCPEVIQSVELNEGQWGKDDCLYTSNFLIDGRVAKNKVKLRMDYKNKLATYPTVEGTLLETYKSFKISFQVTPREQGSLMHLTMEYEKPTSNVPDPNSMLQFLVHCCKDIDAYLTQKANTQRTPQLQYN